MSIQTILGLCMALTAACRERHPGPAVEDRAPPAALQSGASRATAPPPAAESASVDSGATGTTGVAPKSLAHCLQAPVVPSPAEQPRIGTLQHYRCGDSRREGAAATHVLFNAGTSGSSKETTQTIDELVGKLQHELSGTQLFEVGHGTCCSDGGVPAGLRRHSCVRIMVSLCARPLAELGSLFQRVLEEGKLTDRALGLEVAYVGQTGPRCRPDQAQCLPHPYLSASFDHPWQIKAGAFALPYDPALPRRVVTRDGARNIGGVCRHDGECGASGGNGCGAWYIPAPPGGSHVGYTRMYDDFCGCVNGSCSWFTPERPALVLEALLKVEGWGEPKIRDPRRFEVGYGTGEEVMTARLQNRRTLRQLQRCYLDHPEALPQTLILDLTVGVDGKLRRHRVTGADDNVRPCVDQVFGWLAFPSRRNNSPVTNGTGDAKVTGKLSLRLE